MKEVEKAYLAAFIDGEGTITLRFRKVIRKGRNDRMFFEPRIIIHNTEIEVLKYIRTVIGGTLKIHTSTSNGKICYALFIHRQNVIKAILEVLLPYFRIKRKKKLAELLLEWIRIHQKVKHEQHPYIKAGRGFIWSAREFEILEEIRKLNKK